MARLIEHPRESPVTCSPSPLPPVSPEPEVAKRNTHPRMNLLERRPLLRPTSKAFPGLLQSRNPSFASRWSSGRARCRADLKSAEITLLSPFLPCRKPSQIWPAVRNQTLETVAPLSRSLDD
jgi:hypothetical protein